MSTGTGSLQLPMKKMIYTYRVSVRIQFTFKQGTYHE